MYYESNKSAVLARNEEYRQSHKPEIEKKKSETRRKLAATDEYRKKRNEKQAAYRKKNSARVRAAERRWYKLNKKRVAETKRAYRQRNPTQVSTAARRRRAKLALAYGSHSNSDIHDLVVDQLGRCNACGCQLAHGFHVDHIMPLARGGSNSPSNLQILCPTCNVKKHDKHPLVWLCEVAQAMPNMLSTSLEAS